MNPSSRYCIATITDEAFLPGTKVMLGTFLHHNPWFKGDIVILHDGYTDRVRSELSTFPNVHFRKIGDEFKRRLLRVFAHLPQFAGDAAKFFTLEAFALTEYERVLFLDSDILCVGDTRELMVDAQLPLLCAPDQCYFREQVRDADTYLPLTLEVAETRDNVLRLTFNSGMMVINSKAIDSSVYQQLVQMVDPHTWRSVRTGHTDSIVLNRYFQNQWQPLPEKFNYLISRNSSRYRRQRSGADAAVLLHFLGNPKPWQVQDTDLEMFDDERAAAFRRWQSAAT